MKKHLALYIVPFLVFVISLGVLNYKYDPFYRLSGINNEKRQIIENHLSDQEQQYLIDNSIPVDRFIRFCPFAGFDIYKLEYFESLEEKMNLTSSYDVVKKTSNILHKLNNRKDEQELFDRLLDLNLVDVCVNNDDFNFDYLDYYLSYFETVEHCDKQAVITSINQLVELLDLDSTRFIETYAKDYDLEGLLMYANQKQENPDLTLVENPSSLTTIVLKNQTIANYEPSPLTIPYQVNRVRFITYLRKDACEAVLELVDDFDDTIEDEVLLIVDGYEKMDGTHEEELGLTLDFMVLGIDYHDFARTEASQYLQDNAHRFGFILRYNPSVNSNVYRYVGKNAARLMKEKNITLEEYEGVIDE